MSTHSLFSFVLSVRELSLRPLCVLCRVSGPGTQPEQEGGPPPQSLWPGRRGRCHNYVVNRFIRAKMSATKESKGSASRTATDQELGKAALRG